MNLLMKKQNLISSVQTGNCSGFTLIELMVTLAVLGIIAFIATPSLRSLVLENRVASEKSLFIASLQYARSEAVARGVPVSVTGLSSTAGKEFSEHGWVVWVDKDGNGNYDSSTSETLRKYEPVKGINIGRGSRYTFNPQGFISFLPNNGSKKVLLCASGHGQKPYLITVLKSGQVDAQQGDDSESSTNCS